MSAILLPLTLLYRMGAAIARARRLAGKRWSGDAPVILVGNLTTGGTGKTPLVAALARELAGLGRRPAIVSRGYRGRRSRDPAVVSDGTGSRGIRLGAAQAGDEPRMMAGALERVPVVVGRDRIEACEMACRAVGARCLILDDAFQQRERFPGALRIVTVNARQPLVEGRLLPAGRLREPAESLSEAHVVVVTHGRRGSRPRRLGGLGPNSLVFNAEHVLEGFESRGGSPGFGRRFLAGKSVLALTAIGYPAGFTDTLILQGGVRRVSSFAMPDHYAWRRPDLERALVRAREEGCAAVVTSAKDEVRMPSIRRTSMPFLVARVSLAFARQDARRLSARLKEYLRLFPR